MDKQTDRQTGEGERGRYKTQKASERENESGMVRTQECVHAHLFCAPCFCGAVLKFRNAFTTTPTKQELIHVGKKL